MTVTAFLGVALSIAGQTPASPPATATADLAVFDVVTARMPHLPSEQALRLTQVIIASGREHRLPTSLVLGIMQVESSFRSRAISPAGALGLMQVMPKTGRQFAARIGVRWRGSRTLFEPEANIRIGTAYLAWLLERFDGRRAIALAAYCHGPGRIRGFLRAQGRVPYRRLRYARKVRRAEQGILRQWQDGLLGAL